MGCWWIKRAKFVLKLLLKSGQGLTPYWPHPQPLSKGERGVVCCAALVEGTELFCICAELSAGLFCSFIFILLSASLPTGLTPVPSPRGEGRGMLCCFGEWRLVITMIGLLLTYILLWTTRLITPLSPWRGRGMLCCFDEWHYDWAVVDLYFVVNYKANHAPLPLERAWYAVLFWWVTLWLGCCWLIFCCELQG